MSASSPSSPPAVPPLPSSPDASQKQDPNRRTSFNFLRRQKSTETKSGGMLSRKSKGYQYPAQQAVPRVPPQLPAPQHFATMDQTSFIGNEAQAYAHSPGAPSNYSASSPYYQTSSPPSTGVDPSARTESMAHRGRYSYASSAMSATTGINSPRRVRRRKDPTPFNILVIGAQGSGKTSFIEFLRNSLSSKSSSKRDKTPSPPQTALPVDSPFTPHYLETTFDHERIGVTLWDSHGLEKKFVDLQLREMSSFLESKFEETFTEEQKVIRAPGVRDTHIHCVFLILDPGRLDSNLAKTRKANTGHTRFEEPPRLLGVLDEDLDVQVLKTLQGKTTVIPVISKADTITTNHMDMLKRAVWASLKQAKLDPLEALHFDEGDSDDERLDERDEDEILMDGDTGSEDIEIKEIIDRPESQIDPEHKPQARSQAHRRSPSGLSVRLSQAAMDTSSTETPFLPMSIISPDSYEPGVVGRRFPWGFADPYNADHCDFIRLKDSVFSDWRSELREASREIWYEGWRTSRLNRRGGTSNGNGTPINGRTRDTNGSASPLGSSLGSPYGGGPVGSGYSAPGTAYGSPQGVPRSLVSSGPQNGTPTPEMARGVYQQGLNAF